ncbi:MAG: InlB B-repeat-containing protein [Clostridiales bacterium]|nr:InlB B-repeat-containing protein [Clostridiales bacterium]
MKKSLLLFALFIISCLLLFGCGLNQEPPPKTLTVNYLATEGGYIQGEAEQTVLKEESTTTVIAIANEGYKFVKWSDNVLTPERTDENITENLTITAIFERISFTVIYLAEQGGSINGNNSQTVYYGNNANSVLAIPNTGYRFVKWSDNVLTAERKDEFITDNITVTAIFEKLSCTVNYYVTEGGYIDGEVIQTVLYGEYASTVTAIPNEDFRFIAWDDGYTETQRTDRINSESQTFTALFERIGKTFIYVYNNAMENNDESHIVLYYDSLYAAKFPTPKRINSTFEGWYLEKDFMTQVTDKNGKFLLDAKIFDSESDSLYAKFNIIEEVNYKILMVYVTEVEGTFETIDGKQIYVHYIMSDLERQLAKTTTIQFAKLLNEMFAGLVNFEVDEYFTTQTICVEDFRRGYISDNYGTRRYDYILNADRIPELSKEYLDNYRSVITSSSFETYGNYYELYAGSGTGTFKFANVAWDATIGLYLNEDSPLNFPLEDIIDSNNPNYDIAWKSNIISTYIHEFAHTVEQGMPGLTLSYHDALFYYNGAISPIMGIDTTRLYLLKQFQPEENGEKYGIPYDFWRDEFYLNVTFTASEGGKIIGNLNQKVKIGRDSETVIAVPDFGYKFVGWKRADGTTIEYKEAELTITKVLHINFEYVAIFEEITQAITYVGIIDNTVDPDYVAGGKVSLKDFLETGLWVPQKDGYEFEGWYFNYNFTQPFGDKYGNVTEDDYKIFDKEQFGNSIILYGKFTKKE